MKRPGAFVFIVVLFIHLANAQEDSLLLALSETRGTQRIDVLHELITKVWLNYPSKGMEYAEEALEIARGLGDSTYISSSLRMIGGLNYYKGDYIASLNYNLRALDIAVQINDSTLINNCYNNIGLLYYNLGSYQTSLEYLLRAKKFKEKRGESYGMAVTLNNIGLRL
jgi:tetratricopeptide (TPR) repeat protein